MSTPIPSVEDYTQRVIDRINASFIGAEVQQPLDTFEDSTTSIFGVDTGHKIKARGSAKIESLLSTTGQLNKISVPGIGTFWASNNLTFTFRYTAWSRAERWLYPGGAFVDYPWFNATPAGTIKFIVIFNQQSGALTMDILVDPSNDDRPNRFIKEWVVPKFHGNFDNMLEMLTGVQVS